MESESLISKAQNKPLTEDLLFDEFSSLASTVFKLDRNSFSSNLDKNSAFFLNHKEIKKLRQRLFAELSRLRKENKIEIAKNVTIQDPKLQADIRTSREQEKTKLNVLLRNKDQVDDLVESIHSNVIQSEQIQTVCLDFEFGRDYLDSVAALKKENLKVGIATTRILKPQEYINLKVIHSMNPDFILVRNLGALYYFKNIQKFNGQLKGDFSLNVTNHKTFEYLLENGLDSICLSYDLNFEQTMALLKNVDAAKAEVTIHQSMPSFHMEHCVFAAFLSKGKSYKDCGKPCEKHKVQLKDQFGHYHWIKPDHECRNTMFNSSAQTALPYLQQWQSLGLGEIRFEALHEAGDELIKKIKNYIDVLAKKQTIDFALQDLKARELYGLSPRQLNKSNEYQARKKDHSFL